MSTKYESLPILTTLGVKEWHRGTFMGEVVEWQCNAHVKQSYSATPMRNDKVVAQCPCTKTLMFSLSLS